MIINLLDEEKLLEPQFKDHSLIGNLKGFRECHIQPDWLLIYKITKMNVLLLADTGTHSDLFKNH